MNEFDQYKLGRLTQAVDNLSNKIESLETDMKDLKAQMNKGKGMIFGMLLMAGGIGAGITAGFSRLFGK